MNITFLIGNGFDVGLGMKSRFKDFFPRYVKKSEDKKPEIRRLSEEIGSDYDTWADFETQMGKYTQNFGKEDSQLLRQQFEDFQLEFVQYLREEEQELSFSKQEAISNMMISALSHFYENPNLLPQSHNAVAAVHSKYNTAHKYSFICFNYTSILEKCLATIPSGLIQKRKVNGYTQEDKVGKVVHVHGTLDNAPLMGVDNATQIANKELAADKRFVRYLVKPLLNSAHRTNQEEDAKKMISESQIICVYGMAMGATDQSWWSRIISWLHNGVERHLVIFDYDSKFNHSSQFSWIEKEDLYIDKLAEYTKGSGIDVENLRNRIHIAVHRNIFEMNLRTQREEQAVKKMYGLTESDELMQAYLDVAPRLPSAVAQTASLLEKAISPSVLEAIQKSTALERIEAIDKKLPV